MYYTNTYMVGSIDNAGNFKPYQLTLYTFRYTIDLREVRLKHIPLLLV